MKTLMCTIMMLANLSLAEQNVKALDVLAKTLYHEARGEGETGLRAVASTIYNRALKRDKNPSALNCAKQAKARKQYSCWNGKEDLEVGKGPMWEMCREIAYEMVTGKFKATTNHTHYYAHKKVSPVWAKKVTKTVIGNHTFLTVR
jgi:N-acetylmuramoyl-L-alanine amidase